MFRKGKSPTFWPWNLWPGFVPLNFKTHNLWPKNFDFVFWTQVFFISNCCLKVANTQMFEPRLVSIFFTDRIYLQDFWHFATLSAGRWGRFGSHEASTLSLSLSTGLLLYAELLRLGGWRALVKFPNPIFQEKLGQNCEKENILNRIRLELEALHLYT